MTAPSRKALAGTGLNQGSSIDDIARKAASDKIEELIRRESGRRP